MIKILIQRKLVDGMENAYHDFSKDALQAAVMTPGFVSAEPLVDLQNPNNRFLIIKMRSLQHWYTWQNSEARQEALSPLQNILMEPEKVTLLRN